MDKLPMLMDAQRYMTGGRILVSAHTRQGGEVGGVRGKKFDFGWVMGYRQRHGHTPEVCRTEKGLPSLFCTLNP